MVWSVWCSIAFCMQWHVLGVFHVLSCRKFVGAEVSDAGRWPAFGLDMFEATPYGGSISRGHTPWDWNMPRQKDPPGTTPGLISPMAVPLVVSGNYMFKEQDGCFDQVSK